VELGAGRGYLTQLLCDCFGAREAVLVERRSYKFKVRTGGMQAYRRDHIFSARNHGTCALLVPLLVRRTPRLLTLPTTGADYLSQCVTLLPVVSLQADRVSAELPGMKLERVRVDSESAPALASPSAPGARCTASCDARGLQVPPCFS